jgi:hypothetical protein
MCDQKIEIEARVSDALYLAMDSRMDSFSLVLPSVLDEVCKESWAAGRNNPQNHEISLVAQENNDAPTPGEHVNCFSEIHGQVHGRTTSMPPHV